MTSKGGEACTVGSSGARRAEILLRMICSGLLLSSLALAQPAPTGPTPQVLALTPSEGPIAGGTMVTVTGSGFSGAIVRIDGAVAAPVAQSDTSIVLRMAPHDNGYVVIGVTAADRTSTYARFLYVPPRLDEIPPGYITTVAGVGNFKGDFGPASEASLAPLNLAFGPSGDLYVAEPDHYVITRITPGGVAERFAGTGEILPGRDQPCCGDGGAASQALITFARGLTVDRFGNVFIADKDVHRIRRVDGTTGVITTVAGTGVRGFSGDGGLATEARIGSPTYVTNAGDDLYFIDFDAIRLRRIDRFGRISTVAGTGVNAFGGDGGPASLASFNLTSNPDDSGLAADSRGNVYLIDQGNHRIRRIEAASGLISTFFEIPAPPSRDPLAMVTVGAIAVDRDDNVYYGGSHIVKLSPGGTPLGTWGLQPSGFSPDGTSLEQMRVGLVTGMTFDSAGNLVYSDQAAGRVRRMNRGSARLETIAGVAPGGIGEEGPAVGAVLFLNSGGDVAMTRGGDMLIADQRVRRVDRAGIVTTIAGRALHTGMESNLDNVPALQAYNGALALHVGPTDEIDTVSFLSVPFHIDGRGVQRSLVGRNNDCGYTGDGGPAGLAQLCQPWDITRDRDGNVFIADTNNNRIRRIDARTGIITTFAGGGPVGGFENYNRGTFCGDGGPARDACFNTPLSVAFDDENHLFVADFANNRIRKIDLSTGIITTFAHTESSRLGVATIRFHRGFLYTHYGDRIVRFDRSGRLTVLAGRAGTIGFGGDGGPALAATLNVAHGLSAGLAFDDDDNLFFVDAGNRRVRAIRAGAR